MPFLPQKLSNLNEKVETARKGFNASIDKAGHKSGVFKSPSINSSTSSNLNNSKSQNLDLSGKFSNKQNLISNYGPPPPISDRPSSHPSSNQIRLKSIQPPPIRNVHVQNSFNKTISSSQSFDEPPPSISKRPSFSENINQELPPSIAKKPSSIAPPTPFRPPTDCPPNGYGPPSLAPVQPSSRYGPPSPPPTISLPKPQLNSLGQIDPPPLISNKKPSSYQFSNLNPPSYSSLGHKHSSIPFPPFSQFNQTDKLAFFKLLDEFFSQKLHHPNHPSHQSDHPPPPTISLHTRPSSANLISTSETPLSRAQSLAIYFKNHHQWSSHSDQWYSSPDPLPTPAQNSNDVKRMSSWTQTGNSRTQINYLLFPDLSQIWTCVIFDVSRPFPPQSAAARFRPPPGPFDSSTLQLAAETYGPQLALFAENAHQSGQHVARGECWDLANEALIAFPAENLQVPQPLTSISRTHGALLYHGRATGRGIGEGEWKGQGDLGNIRRGDVIEWRLVACDTVNPKSMCTLGDPEHTAIIVDAQYCIINQSTPAPPSQLGHITVIEQSLKQIPCRRTYDLSTMSRGQVWIYRPMSEADLLGPGRNQCLFPPPQPSYEA